jgi:hypothetical protein
MAALVLAGLGAQAVYADTDTPPTPPDGRRIFAGGKPGMRRLGPAGLEAAANVLGMTTDELSAELESGRVLAELAGQKGVPFEDVQAAIREAHQQQMLERINQAVADGSMTQAKADWLIEGIENGYMDGPGFGFGFGPGGPRGGRGPKGAAPAQQ